MRESGVEMQKFCIIPDIIHTIMSSATFSHYVYFEKLAKIPNETCFLHFHHKIAECKSSKDFPTVLTFVPLPNDAGSNCK